MTSLGGREEDGDADWRRLRRRPTPLVAGEASGHAPCAAARPMVAPLTAPLRPTPPFLFLN